ncbi:MAG: hypothetical protein RR504_07750, partial [Christensenellaceae bacterium]
MGQKLVWDDKRKKLVSVMELNERLSMEKEEKERKRLEQMSIDTVERNKRCSERTAEEQRKRREQMSIDTVERNERRSGMGSPHEPNEVGRG